MKVTFKLTERQQFLTIGALRAWEDTLDGLCAPQRFTREGELLTYEGQRGPLHHGAASAVVTALGGRESLSVVSYETTDPALKWWETKIEAVNRLPLEEQLDYIELLNKKKEEWKWSLGQAAYAASFRAIERADELAIYKSDRAASAQLSRQEYALRARILKFIPGYNLGIS